MLKEQSDYSWEGLKEGTEEWEKFQELLQKLRDVKEKIRITPEYKREFSKLLEEEKDIINRIVRLRAAEIVEMAYHRNADMFDAIIHLDPDDGELIAHYWTSNTYLNDESNLVEIYRLRQNWIGNGCWDNVNDILYDEEWEKLQEKYGDEADFMDEEQLKSIGIDLDTRLMDYLRYEIEENY
jgi:hypothetical protein